MSLRCNNIQYKGIQHKENRHKYTQHKGVQHKDTQHKDTQHKDTQHNRLNCDTVSMKDIQHNGTQHKLKVALSAWSHFLIVMLSVIVLNVVWLSAVASSLLLCRRGATSFCQLAVSSTT
jgi:hypothetical protein